MKTLKTIVLFNWLFLSAIFSPAQDPHFSQYQASPLTLNPAMTGMMNQDYRVSLNYRTQYWSVGSNFTTGTVSFEHKVNTDEFENNKNRIAWGVFGLFDQSANGGFKNVNVGLSGSYAKILDEQQKQALSIGFQGVLSSRAINVNGLSFANQFVSGGFNLSIPSNETVLNNRRTYADINTGIAYSFTEETQLFYIGASMYHVNKPEISFQKDQKHQLPTRYVLHTGYRFVINDNKTYVLINANYMKQAKATNLMLGSAVGFTWGYDQEDAKGISAGLWVREGDAIIPYVGLDWRNYQLGVTYDILYSQIKEVSPKTGGFELSLRFGLNRKDNPYIHNIIGREY